jgi:hypothetical protein
MMRKSLRCLSLGVLAILLMGLVACSQPSNNSSGNGIVLPDVQTGSSDIKSDAKKDTGTTAGEDTSEEDAGATDEDAQGPEDTYDGPACTTSSACKNYPGKPFCAVALKQCVECLTEFNCKDGQACENFQCKDTSCSPGTTSCDGDFLLTCAEDGKSQTTEKCPDETPVCVGGACKKCEPGQQFCDKAVAGGQSKQLMQCSADGNSSTVKETCAGDSVCLNKKCMVCAPGSKLCNGAVAMACSDDGMGMEVADDCGAKGLTCLGGLCVNACAGDFKSNTYVGCDFYAVDLDNAVETSGGGVYDAQNKQYAVVVSNTADAPATVTVSMGQKGSAGYKTKNFPVAGKGLQVINLPDKSWGVPNQNQDNTNINDKVYRIVADQPIVAYQFNPLDNFGVFSNDASLLLPSSSLGKAYYVMTRRQLADKYRSYINIIATAAGDTTVAVKVTCKTQAGPGIPSLKKGGVGTYTLKQGQALNLESDEAGGDLTGSYVESDKPVAVFGGSEASNSPDTGNCVPKATGGGKACAGTSNSGFAKACTSDSQCDGSCCADHLEEQMFPIDTLGTSYVASRLQQRGKEKDSWRILAVQDGTTVTTTPNVATVPVLNKGAWYEIVTDKDFTIDSNKPVLVAQYMASSYATITTEAGTCSIASQCTSKYGFQADCLSGGFQNYCAPIGDPSLILAAATNQYLDDYIFLVPDKYKINYINVVVPAGTVAKLDGNPIGAGSFVSVQGSLWTVARLPIAAGSHRLQLTNKGSLTVYGYDKDVSYGYIGGAGLAVGGQP